MNGLRAARLGRIEQRQHLRAAVPAAHADHAGDRRIAPRLLNRGGAQLRRAGHVSGRSRKHRVVVDRNEPEAPNLLDSPIELLPE